ncbi:MAG: NADH:flavin oxidoreductase [Desulfobacteraceae bacterium]|nr:NADH:flavin oxidoreductase [Desulfobacteraceae bacterium]
MTEIFEKTSINTMALPNRLVRSATWEGMCDPDGRPGSRLIEYYNTLAKGGIGLIISGYTFICPEGKQLPGQMGIHTDDFADTFNKMTDIVHNAGGKIAIQLVHAGGQANQKMSGHPPLAPSAVKVAQFPVIPTMLSQTDIKDIVKAFSQASLRAKSYGFDGIQIHCAHGYLINQFLSPLTNQRADEYGGSIENRSRFLFKVYEEIRSVVGESFPLFIKLNAADYVDGGLEIEDAVWVSKKLSQKGIDAIEVSSGTGASGALTPIRTKIISPDKEAYNLEHALAIKDEVSCPVMAVGGFRSSEIIEKAIKEKGIDFISLSRPLIREPDLPDRWKQGDNRPAACISCNKCFKPGLFKGGIYCVPKRAEANNH